MNLPSAIIFINSEILEITKTYLTDQLFLNEIILKNEFDSRLLADPNYTDNIHNQNLRILVILDDFQNYSNRDYADVVIFVKQGLATVEKNKFGPPMQSLPILRLTVWSLLRAGSVSDKVIILPSMPPKVLTECECDYPIYGLGGIVAIELRDSGIVACRNPDNIYNNPDFINRK
jgi:hypothetical protein